MRNSSGNRISFVGLLTIVFVVLKLTDYIAWSWIWVLSPLWLSAIITICLVLYFLYTYKKYIKKG
jgi:hypothetical protein